MFNISPIEWDLLGRLLLATVLGAIIGLEREHSGKVAGLRTHALVALGSAIFTVISILVYTQFPNNSGQFGYDNRIIANIIVGIGFIGAGAIIRRPDKVEGTTTAASLWAVAGIGTASGFGFFTEAIGATVIAYCVLALLWLLEKYASKTIKSRKFEDEGSDEDNRPIA